MNNSGKKVSERRCVGCYQSCDKTSLLRIVRVKGEENDNKISLDLTGKKNGRGVYIHKSEKCLNTARKKRAFERALKQAIPEEVYEALSSEINKESSNSNEQA